MTPEITQAEKDFLIKLLSQISLSAADPMTVQNATLIQSILNKLKE